MKKDCALCKRNESNHETAGRLAGQRSARRQEKQNNKKQEQRKKSSGNPDSKLNLNYKSKTSSSNQNQNPKSDFEKLQQQTAREQQHQRDREEEAAYHERQKERDREAENRRAYHAAERRNVKFDDTNEPEDNSLDFTNPFTNPPSESQRYFDRGIGLSAAISHAQRKYPSMFTDSQRSTSTTPKDIFGNRLEYSLGCEAREDRSPHDNGTHIECDVCHRWHMPWAIS